MSRSAIYAVNSNSQTVEANGVINFGSIVRRYGCNCNVAGGNIVVDGAGYYDVMANINIALVATGDLTVTLYKDGVAIPGALVELSGLTAGTVYAIAIPAIIRDVCCCESTITAVVSANATVSNAAIKVIKL